MINKKNNSFFAINNDDHYEYKSNRSEILKKYIFLINQNILRPKN